MIFKETIHDFCIFAFIFDPKNQEKEGNCDKEGSFRASPEEYV